MIKRYRNSSGIVLLHFTLTIIQTHFRDRYKAAYMGGCTVAQSVERWTPCGGSTRPGFKSPRFEVRRAPDVYRASWRVWLRLVAGRSQLKPANGTGRARLCAYVKLSTLNSAIRPGIARSEGRGQGQRNKLCLAGALSLPILPIKGFGLNLFKKNITYTLGK